MTKSEKVLKEISESINTQKEIYPSDLKAGDRIEYDGEFYEVIDNADHFQGGAYKVSAKCLRTGRFDELMLVKGNFYLDV